MYENAFHRELCVQLSMALHLKSAVKDSQLLQAYATLHAIVEAGRPDYQEAYRHIFCTNSCEYNYAVLCTYGKETRECPPFGDKVVPKRGHFYEARAEIIC